MTEPVTAAARASLYPGRLRPLWVIAGWLGRSQETLRDWCRRGLLEPRACDVRTRALLVDMADAAALDERLATRRRRSLLSA